MHIKQLVKLLFFILFLSCNMQFTRAQVGITKSENKVIIEGKVFYLHVVKPGQTLYSISKAYMVTEAEISHENPGADKGLQVSQVLKIPAAPSGNYPLTVAVNVPVPSAVPADTSQLKHVVKQGETMYSISRRYNIKIQDLEDANPMVINNEINPGQLINIPRIKEEIPLENFIYHKVRRRETVFGITRMYNITADQLEKYNPELLEKFPRPGQMLKIPKHIEEARNIADTVQAGMDSLKISDSQVYDTVRIADSYSFYLDSLPKISGRIFNVAYLVPFNYKPVSEPVPLDEMSKNADDIINLDNVSNPNDQMLSSRNFLEFIEGSLLAIDSLKKEGIDLNVFIFDTQKSPTRVREIINSHEFQKMDLIIGPFYSYNVEIVSEFSRAKRIPMVSPFSSDPGPIEFNPFLFQLNPGFKTEFDQMADYLDGFRDKNIVFIHGTDSIEGLKYNFLKQDLITRLSVQAAIDSLPFKEIVYDLAAKVNLSQDIIDNLSLEKENLVVIPETDEAFVSTVITQLYFQLKNYDISVVGMPHWYAFQNTDFIYFHKLSLTYFTPYYYSYDSVNVNEFLKKYRDIYYAEPVTLSKKGGSYAFLGYDLSFYFLKLIDRYGKRFILHLYDLGGHELMNDFKFSPVGNGGGFENHSLMLVKFHKNLDINAVPYVIEQKLIDIEPTKTIIEPVEEFEQEITPVESPLNN